MLAQPRYAIISPPPSLSFLPQHTTADCRTLMRGGSSCAVRMGQSCQTCYGGRIGSAGRVGFPRRGTLQRGNGRVCDRRCRRPTTAARVAASRTRRSMSGGWGDHGQGAGVHACLLDASRLTQSTQTVCGQPVPSKGPTHLSGCSTKARTYLSL
jgi:hypothetical protein